MYKITFFSEQRPTKRGGWSTTFHNSQSDQGPVIVAATALKDRLRACYGNEADIFSMRVSLEGSFRRVKPISFSNIGEGAGGPELAADYPTTALQLVMSGANDARALVWLRGIEDAITDKGGRYSPTQHFVGNLNQVIALLQNPANGWCLRSLDKAQPFKAITDLDKTTGRVTCPGHGFGAVGDVLKVRIKGVNGIPQANAVWSIRVVTSDTFDLSFWVPTTLVIQPNSQPTAQKRVFIPVTILKAEPGIISSHRVGRPFNLLGGKKPKKKK